MVLAPKECLIAHVTTRLFSNPVFGLGLPDEIVEEGPCPVAKNAFLLVEARHGSLGLHSSYFS